MPPQPPQVRVGVGVFILSSPSTPSPNSTSKNPTFLLGIRLNSHGSGTQALPGGHLEFGETFEECAIREVLEETGLQITKPRFLTATNDFISSSSSSEEKKEGGKEEEEKEKKHYVTVFMVCERLNQEDEPENREPEKCGGWEWVDWESLVKWVEEEGKEEENKEDGMRKKVFTPLISLIRQRPGLVPSTALSEQD